MAHRAVRWAYMGAVRRWPKLSFIFNSYPKVQEVGKDFIILRDRTSVIRTDRYHGLAALNESKAWPRCYVPSFSLEGKTVLDCGSGCGETDQFFRRYGAAKVIGVETDSSAVKMHRENARNNGWNTEVINEPFKLAHLNVPHDFLKMDIEGGEIALLDYEKPIGPCRMELHGFVIGEQRTRDIITRFGLKKLPSDDIWGRDD